jgi:hypothetical protein
MKGLAVPFKSTMELVNKQTNLEFSVLVLVCITMMDMWKKFHISVLIMLGRKPEKGRQGVCPGNFFFLPR